MRKSRRGTFRSVVIVAIATAAASVTLAILGGCAEEPAPPIRIGTNPWPGYEFLHLADELGYFEEEGVEVRLVELTSNGDVRRA